jgi:hypothetical protein
MNSNPKLVALREKHGFIPDDDLYEFAEIVIQECIRVCENQRNPHNLNYKPSETFADAIRAEFGLLKR